MDLWSPGIRAQLERERCGWCGGVPAVVLTEAPDQAALTANTPTPTPQAARKAR